MVENLLFLVFDFFLQKVGLFPILASAIVTALVFYITLLIIFTVRRHNDHRAFRRRGAFSIRRIWAGLWDYHYVGGSWLINHMEHCMWTVAILSGAIGYWRAIKLDDANELSRSSSMICIAGLVAVALGLAQAMTIQRSADKLINRASMAGKNKIVENYIVCPIRKAQNRALVVSTIISIVGTLLWAYGDQFFPKKEESAVSECQCIKVIIPQSPSFYGY